MAVYAVHAHETTLHSLQRRLVVGTQGRGSSGPHCSTTHPRLCYCSLHLAVALKSQHDWNVPI